MAYNLPVPKPRNTRERGKFYRREWRRAMQRHGRWPVKVQETVAVEEETPELAAGEERAA